MEARITTKERDTAPETKTAISPGGPGKHRPKAPPSTSTPFRKRKSRERKPRKR